MGSGEMAKDASKLMSLVQGAHEDSLLAAMDAN